MEKKTIVEYIHWFQNYLIEVGMNNYWATLINTVLVALITIVLVILLDIVTRKIILQFFKAFSKKTKATYDDFLMQSNFPRFIAHFLPLALLWYFFPIILEYYPKTLGFIQTVLKIYLVILCILIFRSVLRSTNNYLRAKREKFSDKPLDSYLQVLMIFAWGIGIFFIINLLTGYDVKSLATLGAASAVILIIFKDTLLGFVASIQISVNDNVRIGDWITFSKYGADGYVTEINLATVKVQNFDNTYTTIPTYSLVSDSFQNWRGMQESDGRRIKRSLFLKQSSVHFLTSEEIETLKKIQLIAPYIEHRQKEIDRHNKVRAYDKSVPINGRNQTNLGVFRRYAEAYLHENDAINKDMLLMVRHLSPTEKGLPVEIFCFSHNKNWIEYETIQAEIFDHLIASMPYFGLELFEFPTGSDISRL